MKLFWHSFSPILSVKHNREEKKSKDNESMRKSCLKWSKNVQV